MLVFFTIFVVFEQHVLEHGKPDERSLIIQKLAGQIVQMSQQKFASNVVEKCLSFGGPAERQYLINEMLGTTDENEPLQVIFLFLFRFLFLFLFSFFFFSGLCLKSGVNNCQGSVGHKYLFISYKWKMLPFDASFTIDQMTLKLVRVHISWCLMEITNVTQITWNLIYNHSTRLSTCVQFFPF